MSIRVCVGQRVGVLLALLATLLTTACFLYFPPAQMLKMKEAIWSGHQIIDRKQQVLLWTMVRSGSMMTQDLLRALPCSFLTEEPLRLQKGKGIDFSVQLMKDILQCRFSQRPDYFRKWVNGSHMNELEVKERCKETPQLCSDARLTDAMCSAACVRLLRVVAVELGLAGALLKDPNLTVRIVHLVRDPRALVASRESLQKVFGKVTLFYDEERNVTTICDRYSRDLAAARSLSHRYPSRYTLVRYEDLALHPHSEMRRLYAFLDLPYTAQVANTVTTHTLGFLSDTSILLDPFSTFRNASANVFAWRRRLPFREVARLQKDCGTVIQSYGYHAFPSPRHYHDLQHTPLLPLPPLL